MTSIEKQVFSRRESLTTVILLGDAPKITFGGRIFENSSSPAPVYRKAEAKGWGKTWGGRPVKLISENP